MKKTSAIKTALLIITISILYAVPASASESITGCLDVFTKEKISGWACEADTSKVPELRILITNSVTGEAVKQLDVKPSYKRSDLDSRFGENAVTGFTVSLDMESLPDGSYSAALFHNGGKFANTLYYTKGNGAAGLEGLSAHSLGSFRLTAYCPCRSCSEGWGRHTSSGALAVSNHTAAVDPRVIPIGSRLLIDGTVYTAEDVGGAVKGNHIDIYFDSHAETRQFGSRAAEVCILQ